jgi:tetratricopeptide (TPR) repeat protein
LDASRALVRWAEKHEAAIEIMRGVVAELAESGWAGKSQGWRKGYMISLKYLAELEEHEEMLGDARAHYQQMLQLPREDEREEDLWREERVAAGLRVSKICEFKKDLLGAQAALMDAVSFARLGSVDKGAGMVLDELPPLPDPTSKENTPLFLKALTELSIFYARNDRRHLALELLTTILRARRAATPPAKPKASISAKQISDPCAESATMTYLGELLFAMGDDQQGLAWTKEAYRKSENLAELRGACKEFAIMAGECDQDAGDHEGEEGERAGEQEWVVLAWYGEAGGAGREHRGMGAKRAGFRENSDNQGKIKIP